jgi:hypothetical protein
MWSFTYIPPYTFKLMLKSRKKSLYCTFILFSDVNMHNFIYLSLSLLIDNDFSSLVRSAMAVIINILAKGNTNFPKTLTAHLKIPGVRKGDIKKLFHTEDTQISGATLQNLVARAI